MQVGNGFAIVRQMPQQAFLEQPVKQCIERTPGDGSLLAAEFGEPGRDAPHHIFQDLINLEDVISKGVLEQGLGDRDATPATEVEDRGTGRERSTPRTNRGNPDVRARSPASDE